MEHDWTFYITMTTIGSQYNIRHYRLHCNRYDKQKLLYSNPHEIKINRLLQLFINVFIENLFDF